MKTVEILGVNDSVMVVTYDEKRPCRVCGFPVLLASRGGVDVCPWCDSGEERPEIVDARREAFRKVVEGNGQPA